MEKYTVVIHAMWSFAAVQEHELQSLHINLNESQKQLLRERKKPPPKYSAWFQFYKVLQEGQN